jgi:hypothetical protein
MALSVCSTTFRVVRVAMDLRALIADRLVFELGPGLFPISELSKSGKQ